MAELRSSIAPVLATDRLSRTFGALMAVHEVSIALRPGELIDGTDDVRFRDAWAMARAESFQPVM